MLASLLKLLPASTWITLGVIIALVLGFVWFADHERSVAHTKDVAQDAALARAQIVHNEEVEARAETKIRQQTTALDKALDAPPAADAPHVLVCPRAVAAPRAMPADAGSQPAVHAAAVEPAVVEDIGPETDKRFADADAQITALQDYIKSCIDAGLCRAN